MFENLKEITFELTNRCSLRCKICNIWKEKDKKDLSLEGMKKLLESFEHPVTVSLTGGEPLLHPQFEKIYRYLYKRFLQKKIKNIDVATNAYSQNLPEFLNRNKNYLQPLSLSISVDGLAQTHNKQRGKNDAFLKTIKNILIARKYAIPVMLKFVITEINYSDLLKVHNLCAKTGCFFNFKLFEYIPNYYHRINKISNLPLSEKGIQSIKNSLKEIEKAANTDKDILLSLSLLCIKQYLANKNFNFIKECKTPLHSLFITSQSLIYNCLYQDIIGTMDTWPGINEEKAKIITGNAKTGNCPKCISYHGYLKEFNIIKK